MPERAAREAAEDAAWAGPAIRLGSTGIVPVLRGEARALRIGARQGWSGWADARLLGVWVSPTEAEPSFLPAQVTPPGGAENWNAWLLAEPALLDGITERLRSHIRASSEAGAPRC